MVLKSQTGVLCVDSPMVSAGTQVSLQRRQGGPGPGQPFSLSLVEAVNGCSTLPLSRAGQLVHL